MSPALQRRLFGLLALLVAGSVLAFLSMVDLGENLVYYWSPSDLLARAEAKEALVRLGGQVVPGSLIWDRDKKFASFRVTDGTQEVPVQCHGNPPAMFREGIGVVVEGKLREDGVFHTDRVMVKHNNEYRAPGDGQDMASTYKTLEVDDQ